MLRKNMKIGLGTYAVAWSIGVPGNMPEHPMDIYSFLEFAHTLGFSLVQIADNLPLHQFSQIELNKIYEKSLELDIEIEVGTRGLTIENIRRYLEIAKQLHAQILRVVIDLNEFEPEMHEIHKIVRSLIPELEKYEIRLAIENHDRLKAVGFHDIIKQANSPFVGICLDSVNSIGADEGFDSVFQLLAPYTINLHVKDYIIQRESHGMGFDIVGTPAGKGRLPIRKVVSILESYRKCDSMILELWPTPEQNIEETIQKEKQWVEESAQFLFDVFN